MLIYAYKYVSMRPYVHACVYVHSPITPTAWPPNIPHRNPNKFFFSFLQHRSFARWSFFFSWQLCNREALRCTALAICLSAIPCCCKNQVVSLGMFLAGGMCLFVWLFVLCLCVLFVVVFFSYVFYYVTEFYFYFLNYLSIHLFIYLLIRLPIFLSVYRYNHLFIHQLYRLIMRTHHTLTAFLNLIIYLLI